MFILIIFVIVFIFLSFILVKKVKRPDFGLAEGPATTMELAKDQDLRDTYSNFKEIMIDTLSDKYDNLKVIASGGMGIIVSAVDKVTKKKVAIKTLTPRLHKNPKAIKFFFKECQAIQKMNHPNIIRIYDSADEGFLYYVMEYLEGETLEELLYNQGNLEIGEIIKIGTQVARALQHCHSNGIVHRDIKPSNIYITKEKRTCKVIDFGVVKEIDSKAKETSAIGSPNYASPEQLQAGSISGKSDIYALGVCLFKMATGQYPYDSPDLNTKIFEKPKNLKSLNPNLSPQIISIIEDCIKLDPNQRCDANTLWARLRSLQNYN